MTEENSSAGWVAVLLWTIAVGAITYYIGHFAGGTAMLAECYAGLR